MKIKIIKESQRELKPGDVLINNNTYTRMICKDGDKYFAIDLESGNVTTSIYEDTTVLKTILDDYKLIDKDDVLLQIKKK